MDYEVQTNAILPYVLFAIAYLMVLFFGGRKRDRLGLMLSIALCTVLGMRDVYRMDSGADPVQYAFILSFPADVGDLLGGADYAVFSLLHPITGKILSLAPCFFLLHMLFIPVLVALYNAVKRISGTFFLLTGWLMFINSGLLLVANFFRQGMSVIMFLAILVAICSARSSCKKHQLASVGLPLLHLAVTPIIPCLLACRLRRYYLICAVTFLVLCVAIRFTSDGFGMHAEYFGGVDSGILVTQLQIKVVTIYLMMAAGYWIGQQTASASKNVMRIRSGAIGMLLPTALLLLTSNAPLVGLRYLYYLYAVAFLYVAIVVAERRSEFLFRFSAIGICLFGFVTWTYPSVAKLLIW